MIARVADTKSYFFTQAPVVSSRNYRVIVGAGYWNLSGVHVFAMNLVRGLRARGVEAELLMTEQETDLVSLPRDMMPIPTDIPVSRLPLPGREADWAEHWIATIRYAEEHAPCVFLPMCDFRHSCVSPKFSSAVSVVGSIQGDDPIHYEHVKRLGPYWDAIACVSDTCAERVAEVDSRLASRVHTIPNAVRVPAQVPRRTPATAGQPLRVVYHGVLNTWQKRILDVPKIVEAVRRRGARAVFTVVGSGPQADELRAACAELEASGWICFQPMLPHHLVGPLLDQHDAYLLTSKFEGMPHAMLEAMAHGCVPVVSDVDSGVRQVVENGVHGFRVPIGDIEGFATRLTELASDEPARQRMGASAHAMVARGPFNVDHMVDRYLDLFDVIRQRAETGQFRRPRGQVLPPPAEVGGLSIFPVEHQRFVEAVELALAPEPTARARWTSWRRWGEQTVRRLRRGLRRQP